MDSNHSFQKAFYQKIRHKRHRVALSIASSIARSVLMLLPTMLMRDIYNALELGLDFKGILVASIFTFIIPLVVVISFTIDVYMSKYIFIIIKELRLQALSNILNRRLRTILSYNKSDLFNRIVESIEQIGEYYYHFINNTTWYISTCIVGIFLMLYINWRITLVLLVFVLLQISCSTLIKKSIERVKDQENILHAEGSDYLMRIVTHNTFIKSAQLEHAEAERAQNWVARSWQTAKSRITNQQITATLSFLLTLSRALYLFFTARSLLLTGSMLRGDFIALNSYIIWLTPIFLGVQDCIQDMIISRANKRRVNRYLEDDSAESDERGLSPTSPLSQLVVSDLAFSYEDAKKQLFSDLSFDIRDGEALYIVGASGCGKSSLLNILMNLEPGYTGRILYDGQNLRELDETWLHQNVVMVGQDVDVLQTSLKDNLLYSGVYATDDEIRELLQALKLDYLQDMPGALYWDMQAHPRALSDGEKKRIAIARAILSKPRALLLDEPTAGLDNLSKFEVMRYIKQSVSGFLIVVTHDVVYTEHDRILYMKTYAS